MQSSCSTTISDNSDSTFVGQPKQPHLHSSSQPDQTTNLDCRVSMGRRRWKTTYIVGHPPPIPSPTENQRHEINGMGDGVGEQFIHCLSNRLVQHTCRTSRVLRYGVPQISPGWLFSFRNHRGVFPRFPVLFPPRDIGCTRGERALVQANSESVVPTHSVAYADDSTSTHPKTQSNPVPHQVGTLPT